jgi:hypothetical protein
LEARTKPAPQDEIVRCGAVAFLQDQPPMTGIASDFLAPFAGLYQVRAGHVAKLLRRARAGWCAPEQRFFHFYLGARGGEPVPLNWVLSQPMADHVWLSAGVGSNRAEADRLGAVLRRKVK